jgi:hypothetical protein
LHAGGHAEDVAGHSIRGNQLGVDRERLLVVVLSSFVVSLGLPGLVRHETPSPGNAIDRSSSATLYREDHPQIAKRKDWK